MHKNTYNSRDYSSQYDDPYDPFLCGLASYFVPGLGQIIADETGRGLMFTAAFASSLAVSMVGITHLMFEDPFQNGSGPRPGVYMFAGGMVAGVVTQWWSVADAVKVAKINNMAYRDRHGKAYKIEILPFCLNNIAYATKVAPGATLKIRL